MNLQKSSTSRRSSRKRKQFRTPSRIPLSICIASRCESFPLPPPSPVVYLSILDDIINCSDAKLIRGRCIRHLNSHPEFPVVRHDGAFKMMMSFPGRPKQGAQIRSARRGTSLWPNRQIPETHRRRVAHTLTTVSGAAIAASSEYSEGRAIAAYFTMRSLREESAGDSYLRHVRILYTGRARDCDRGDYWAVLPGLLAIASDPMRRCFEVESCSGGKITKIPPALRKVRRKFTPSDTAATPRDAVSERGYFSLREGAR